MHNSHPEERLPDELRAVADALRDQRPALEPLALDRIKLRAMSATRRSRSSQRKGRLMRTRLATMLTIGFVFLGSSAALAWVGGENFGLVGGSGGSAGFAQYHECPHGEPGFNCKKKH
jgi:hypothetical protein